jgi:hypothetical protein
MARGVHRTAAAAAAVLVGAAVATELRKPPVERTWHGSVAGLVPYDLRPPTFDRFRSRLWNPDDPAVLVPHAFGVGWTVNFAALRELASGRG